MYVPPSTVTVVVLDSVASSGNKYRRAVHQLPKSEDN